VRCQDFRAIADSYLSDELLTETNHDVINHLESCAGCRRELAARRQLRFSLRASFAYADSLQMPDEFAANLRCQLRVLALPQTNYSVPRLAAWLALAACVVLALGLGLRMMQRQPAPPQKIVAGGQPRSKENGASGPRSSPGSPDEDMVLRATMAEISGDAAGDHRNCAIHFGLTEAPIPLEEAALKYDPAYLNLSDVVSGRLKQLSGDMQVIESHSCVFNGRRFAHIVLREHASLISLLVTDLSRPADSANAGTQALNHRDQTVMACSQSEGYETACFETARHAIFIVSDLTEGENLSLARLLAPSVYNHITHVEGSA
jgi:hypothetical protein